VVSGTPATELRDIVARRSMTPYFREVLGAPETKDALLTGLLARYGLAPFELVYIGDAETDWRAAAATGVPFIWRCTAGNTLEDGHSLAIDTMTNLTDRLRQIDPSWR
jgi:phosphoglycolate phosphatase-like HAD superfamily hydrolase